VARSKKEQASLRKAGPPIGVFSETDKEQVQLEEDIRQGGETKARKKAGNGLLFFCPGRLGIQRFAPESSMAEAIRLWCLKLKAETDGAGNGV